MAAKRQPKKKIDREKMRRALIDLRVCIDDADAVTEDMLRPPRRRELGPVTHRKNYGEARKAIVQAHAYAMRLVDGGSEHGDPSGNGGAGPTD